MNATSSYLNRPPREHAEVYPPKHTPGPWRVEVAIHHHDQQLDVDMMHANARLIAAAPDLLTAAKGALAALSQPATFPADIAAAKKWLAEAIAKAEGR